MEETHTNFFQTSFTHGPISSLGCNIRNHNCFCALKGNPYKTEGTNYESSKLILRKGSDKPLCVAWCLSTHSGNAPFSPDNIHPVYLALQGLRVSFLHRMHPCAQHVMVHSNSFLTHETKKSLVRKRIMEKEAKKF